MTKILLIRHGMTDAVSETIAGRIDYPLNPEGIRQSQVIAEALRNLPVEAIFASPLMRTRQSAEPLAEFLNLKVEIIEDLNQVNYGDWQKKPFDELERDPLWQAFMTDPMNAIIPGGENGMMVRKRVARAIRRLCKRYPGDALIACYLHGSIIRHAISYKIGLSYKAFHNIRVSPASISFLEITPHRSQLRYLNQLIPAEYL
jgi:broad specificity phosphatase PhoE